jgi:phosphatidate cytidylyltransferase
MSELGRRIATGLVLAPATVGAVLAGGWWLAGLLAVAAGAAAWELYRLARVGGNTPLQFVGIPIAAAIPVFTHLGVSGVFVMPVSAAVVAALAVLVLAMFRRRTGEHPLGAAAITCFGVLYTGAALSFGYALRYHPYAYGVGAGAALVLFPVWLTWSTDTGAYVAGRLIGGPKLAPAISPNKTIAGAVGGLLVAAGMAWLYTRYVLGPAAQLTLTPAGTVVFATVVAVAAQLGDLAESFLKREAGVKDASQLLPGHGGVLDRLDSIFFVLPTAYLVLPALLVPAPRG